MQTCTRCLHCISNSLRGLVGFTFFNTIFTKNLTAFIIFNTNSTPVNPDKTCTRRVHFTTSISENPKNENSHPKSHAKANKLHAGCNSFSRHALCNRKSRFSHDIRFPARHFSFKQNFSSWARKKRKENEKKRASCGLN